MNLQFEIVIICQILTLWSFVFTKRAIDITSDSDSATSYSDKATSEDFQLRVNTDLQLNSNNVQLILENFQRSLPSSDFSHRRLLNYVARKERASTNCETDNYVNKRLDALDDGHKTNVRCKNATVNGNFDGLNATLDLNSTYESLNDLNEEYAEATSDILRFSEKIVANDRRTIKSYQQFSGKEANVQSSGITRFITNAAVSRSRKEDYLTDEIDYARKKRDDGESNTVVVVGRLVADDVSDVYEYLHKYLKILVDMRNITVVSNDSSMVLNAYELCTKTWTEYFENIEDDGQTYCNSSWDNFSCWPRTPTGSTATIRCPSYLAQINKSQNATKHCYENGTWAERAVYDLCIENTKGPLNEPGTTDSEAVRIIYNVGFSVSTLTLAIALFIFLYFRSLRCLRNSIHCHLIITFIIKNIVWIIMWHSLVSMQTSTCTWCCKALTTIFNFAHATNFFWMFVEGLYLHIIIVWTYSADKIKLQYLLLIGWGLPSVNITAWVIVKILHETKLDVCWLPQDDGNSVYDYIYIGPILFVLFANIIFLSTIVWVLITKLRASHSLETRQYRKAVKATIILFPLLGIIYVIFITPPSNHPRVQVIFTYINAVLQSFQGLLVAVFYCFLNGEVKSVLKKKLSRFNDARSLSTKYTRTSYNWTRNSRDFGNTTTLGNGALTEIARTSGEDGKDTPECIPLTDTLPTDKQQPEMYWNLK